MSNISLFSVLEQEDTDMRMILKNRLVNSYIDDLHPDSLLDMVNDMSLSMKMIVEDL
jgi:hypothetical protein